MTKVGIAELKARLSEHLRSVRNGRRITVVDRSTPIAELVPIQQDPLEIRPASRSARSLPLGKPVLPAGTSSLAVLLEDRSAGPETRFPVRLARLTPFTSPPHSSGEIDSRRR